jgi:hypothetical protein
MKKSAQTGIRKWPPHKAGHYNIKDTSFRYKVQINTNSRIDHDKYEY